MFSEKVFPSSFSTNSRTFSEFDAGNTIFFQIKVFGEKVNGATVTMYLIKIAARSSLTRLINIMQINRIH